MPDGCVFTPNRLATFNGQPVDYDADGNMTYGPLKGSMAAYAFDSRNRLTGVDGTSYIYNAENNRIAVTEGIYRTEYIINPQAPLSQVLIKTDSQGNQTFYLYGLGLIAQEENDAYRTYHYDLRGSTVALTDETGTVTDRFQHGPYGELVDHSGNAQTPFLYNGRDGVITDANGLYYMRARYYNPECRAFLSLDLLRGDVSEPKTLNRYSYVSGQPITLTDPSGHITIAAGVGGLGGAVLGLGIELMRVWDFQGNKGFALVVQTGGYGGLSGGGGVALQFTSAETVYDLSGPAFVSGGGFRLIADISPEVVTSIPAGSFHGFGLILGVAGGEPLAKYEMVSYTYILSSGELKALAKAQLIYELTGELSQLAKVWSEIHIKNLEYQKGHRPNKRCP